MEVHYRRKHPNQFNIFAFSKKQITECNFNNPNISHNQVNVNNQSNLVNTGKQPHDIMQQKDSTSSSDTIQSQLDQTNEVEMIMQRIKKLSRVQLLNLMVKLYPIVNPIGRL